MSIFNQRKEFIEYISSHSYETGFNETIFEILEGNLLKYVAESLREQLSPDSYATAMERVAPINVFKKANEKLSTLYVEDPVRKTELESDQELVDSYTMEGSINTFMEDLNKGFNAYKWSVIELYENNNNGVEQRVLPSHQFLPYSDDKKNPLHITAIIKFMGEYKKVPAGRVREKTVRRYWIYTATEFMAIDSDGELIPEDMAESEGINPYGVIPFIFVSKSRYLLVPMPDEDDLKMSILFPVLLTDLNFAAKFLAHSIFYGIDIDADNLKLSPDAVWIFKSDADGKKPEIGTIKPEVSIEEVVGLAKEQIEAWLDTKNIKAGTAGKVGSSNMASGLSKIVDEADTSVARKSQEKFFKKVELEFWKTLSTMHNKLIEARMITNKKAFSETSDLVVSVTYQEQLPIVSRSAQIAELKLENEAGFKSKQTAIKQLNPELTPEEIEEEIVLIDEERTITIEEPEDGNEELGKPEDQPLEEV